MRTKPKLPILQRGHPLARGLVGAWLFYEGTGVSTRDLSPYHDVATLNGDAAFGSGEGGYITFDGDGDFVDTGRVYSPSIVAGGGHVSVVARVRSASWSGMQCFIGERHVEFNRGWMFIASDSSLQYTQFAQFDETSTGITLVENQWNTVAFTYDRAHVRFYAEGLPKSEHSHNTLMNQADQSSYVGALHDRDDVPDDLLSGQIGYLYVYNRALSVNEVRALYIDPYQALRSRPAPLAALVATPLPITTVRLTWQDNASDEDGFRIERGEDGVVFDEIATVAADVTQYDDEELPTGETFYYRVRAYNDDGNSDYSNVAQITTTE